MELSQRLKTIASFVKKGSIIADVGTDHGYVPIDLARRGMITKAYALDVKEGPLSRAQEHIKECRVGHIVETRLSDGLEALAVSEADTIIMAGMGGLLIMRLLEEGKEVLSEVDTLILSPHTWIEGIRPYIEKIGFVIVKEAMVLEDGIYYTVMEAVRNKAFSKSDLKVSTHTQPDDELTVVFNKYGRYLLEHKDPLTKQYLIKLKENYQRIIAEYLGRSSASKQRSEKLAYEIHLLDMALSFFI